MFSRFTSVLYNAMDALAPPLPLQEDFEWHWKSVTRFYSSKNASNKLPIELTSIPGHLMEMLSILEQEEKEVEIGNIGPCMEYVMQNKLLDTMCVLATSDAPPGMKRHMLKFITSVLHIIQQSLIPHVSIYVPVQNFIKLCGEVLAGPTENEEMNFLESICDKLKENPHLVNCFLGPYEEASRSRRSSESSSSIKSADDSAIDREYALVSSLLRMYKSPDNVISTRAGDCLKICCSCANDASAMTIAQCTNLSQGLCECLSTLYKSIPISIRLCDIENPNEKDDDDENVKIAPEKRKYLHFLQKLFFIDMMVKVSHALIADHICLSFKTEFLSIHLYPDLIETNNEDHILLATTLTSSSLRHISSPKLIEAFGFFLLGEEASFEFSERSSYIVKDTLIERCRNNDKSLAVAMSSLQLFEELLQRPTQHILYNLIIKNIENRGYFDHTAVDSWLQFSDDDNCSRFSDDLSQDSPTPRKSSMPSYISKIIDSFLALLPNEIKSCEQEDDSGYETYLKEAHGRFIKCLTVCEDFEWPEDFEVREDYHLGAEDDSSSESQPEADSEQWTFYEGSFLGMIFDKLEQMLQQPYEINLQITSIISHLALFAHPYLHEYMLNPLIPYNPDARSVFTVLFKVSEDIQRSVPNIKGFKTKVKLTRNALLSDGNEYATFEESNILEALIVLEEFCKELAAIAFVKYNAIS